MPRFVHRAILLMATLSLLVGAAAAQDSTLTVSCRVSPAAPALGETIRISATVTNLSDAPATFGHDGCPVWFLLDDAYRPYVGCPEYWTLVTLEPGESITFAADEFPYLEHEPGDYPLGPGRHLLQVRVGDAGETRTAFDVGYPLPDRTYLAGRILDGDRQPLPGALVEFIADAPDGTTDPPTEVHRTWTREGGWFFLGGIRPNVFRMRVLRANDQQLWWPGVRDPALAEPIVARGGTYRGDLDLTFGVQPPAKTAFVGGVIEETLLAVVTPVAGAEVVAVSLPSDALDPALDVRLAQPGFGRTFRTFTGEDGRFELPVEPGAYRLVAGKPNRYGYRWSPQVRIWNEARVYVLGDGQTETVTFAIPPSDSVDAAGISGQVLGYDPVTDGPPAPLENVTVAGIPVFSFPNVRLAAVETNEEGRYRLPVPSSSPWFVQFHRADYAPETWPTGPAVEPVDVGPGRVTAGIDVVLQPMFQPGDGAIEGYVHEIRVNCAGGIDDCEAPYTEVPVPGALVRVSAAYPTFAPYELLARTDENGYFRVEGIWADSEGTLSYYVSAETDRHGPIYYPGGVPFEQAEPLPVFPGQASDAGTLTFNHVTPPRGGFLAGLVVDDAGDPVGGAILRYHVVTAAGPRTFVTRSGSSGNWLLEDLPHPAAGILSVEKEGWIPAYLGPNHQPVYRWDLAERVGTWPAGDPLFDPFPIGIVLPRFLGSGPYLQAGRVQAESAVADSVDGDLGAASLTPRLRALQLHARNVSRAFFYLVNAEAAAPGEVIVGGGVTSDNGTVIVTDLPAGVYFAYADKPGFQRDYFRSEGGGPIPIVLNGSTPAVLAEILLTPIRSKDVGKGEGMVTALLNEPNPFHAQGTTTLYYRLEDDRPVTVTVFDVRGREVTRLLDGALRPAGENTVTWDGTDASGRLMSAGVYVYRVDAGGASSSRKMVLLP